MAMSRLSSLTSGEKDRIEEIALTLAAKASDTLTITEKDILEYKEKFADEIEQLEGVPDKSDFESDGEYTEALMDFLEEYNEDSITVAGKSLYEAFQLMNDISAIKDFLLPQKKIAVFEKTREEVRNVILPLDLVPADEKKLTSLDIKTPAMKSKPRFEDVLRLGGIKSNEIGSNLRSMKSLAIFIEMKKNTQGVSKGISALFADYHNIFKSNLANIYYKRVEMEKKWNLHPLQPEEWLEAFIKTFPEPLSNVDFNSQPSPEQRLRKFYESERSTMKFLRSDEERKPYEVKTIDKEMYVRPEHPNKPYGAGLFILPCCDIYKMSGLPSPEQAKKMRDSYIISDEKEIKLFYINKAGDLEASMIDPNAFYAIVRENFNEEKNDSSLTEPAPLQKALSHEQVNQLDALIVGNKQLGRPIASPPSSGSSWWASRKNTFVITSDRNLFYVDKNGKPFSLPLPISELDTVLKDETGKAIEFKNVGVSLKDQLSYEQLNTIDEFLRSKIYTIPSLGGKENDEWVLADSTSLQQTDGRGQGILIFAFDVEKNVLYCAQPIPGQVHHSMFAGMEGNEISNRLMIGGTFVMEKGKVTFILDDSGHYQNTQADFKYLVAWLVKQGVIDENTKIEVFVKTTNLDAIEKQVGVPWYDFTVEQKKELNNMQVEIKKTQVTDLQGFIKEPVSAASSLSSRPRSGTFSPGMEAKVLKSAKRIKAKRTDNPLNQSRLSTVQSEIKILDQKFDLSQPEKSKLDELQAELSLIQKINEDKATSPSPEGTDLLSPSGSVRFWGSSPNLLKSSSALTSPSAEEMDMKLTKFPSLRSIPGDDQKQSLSLSKNNATTFTLIKPPAPNELLNRLIKRQSQIDQKLFAGDYKESVFCSNLFDKTPGKISESNFLKTIVSKFKDNLNPSADEVNSVIKFYKNIYPLTYEKFGKQTKALFDEIDKLANSMALKKSFQKNEH